MQIQPSLWTGGMIHALGFIDYLRANPGMRLLHHGDGLYKQGSVFGASMNAANTLQSCNKSSQSAVWSMGSTAFANFYGYGSLFFRDICYLKCTSLMMQLKRHETNRHPAHLLPMFVFIGPRFGQGRRPAKESILFKYELRSVLNQLVWGENAQLVLFNFSPMACADVVKISVGGDPNFDEESLEQVIKRLGTSDHAKLIESAGRFGTGRFGVRGICADCRPASMSDGPTSKEIAACMAVARNDWSAWISPRMWRYRRGKKRYRRNVITPHGVRRMG